MSKLCELRASVFLNICVAEKSCEGAVRLLEEDDWMLLLFIEG